MPDLSWTLPVARWSYWSANAGRPADVDFVEPMLRRRLSSLSRMALTVAGDCAGARPAARVVFASRHGELRRTTDILRAIDAGEPVSPNAFSLSVLNAMPGLFGIARRDRSAASALSAGARTLGYALLEAFAQHDEAPHTPLLVVYADEPADPVYGDIEDEVTPCALAVLLDRDAAPLGQLRCAVSERAADAAGVPCFPAQSDALHHCLQRGGRAAWRAAGAQPREQWQWAWEPAREPQRAGAA